MKITGLEEAFKRDLLRGGLTEAQADEQVERSKQRIQRAPAAILLCLDASTVDSFADDNTRQHRSQAEYLMAVQSAAMAGQNLLLAAHALGLGSVWICAPLFAPGAVAQVLNLPASWQPQGLLLLGFPAAPPPNRARQEWTELTLSR